MMNEKFSKDVSSYLFMKDVLLYERCLSDDSISKSDTRINRSSHSKVGDTQLCKALSQDDLRHSKSHSRRSSRSDTNCSTLNTAKSLDGASRAESKSKLHPETCADVTCGLETKLETLELISEPESRPETPEPLPVLSGLFGLEWNSDAFKPDPETLVDGLSRLNPEPYINGLNDIVSDFWDMVDQLAVDKTNWPALTSEISKLNPATIFDDPSGSGLNSSPSKSRSALVCNNRGHPESNSPQSNSQSNIQGGSGSCCQQTSKCQPSSSSSNCQQCCAPPTCCTPNCPQKCPSCRPPVYCPPVYCPPYCPPYCSSPVPNCSPSVPNRDPPVPNCGHPEPKCSPSVPNCSPSVPNCGHPEPNCNPSVPNCSPLVPNCGDPEPNCSPSVPNCSPLVPDCRTPEPDCDPPGPDFKPHYWPNSCTRDCPPNCCTCCPPDRCTPNCPPNCSCCPPQQKLCPEPEDTPECQTKQNKSSKSDECKEVEDREINERNGKVCQICPEAKEEEEDDCNWGGNGYYSDHDSDDDSSDTEDECEYGEERFSNHSDTENVTLEKKEFQLKLEDEENGDGEVSDGMGYGDRHYHDSVNDESPCNPKRSHTNNRDQTKEPMNKWCREHDNSIQNRGNGQCRRKENGNSMSENETGIRKKTCGEDAKRSCDTSKRSCASTSKSQLCERNRKCGEGKCRCCISWKPSEVCEGNCRTKAKTPDTTTNPQMSPDGACRTNGASPPKSNEDNPCPSDVGKKSSYDDCTRKYRNEIPLKHNKNYKKSYAHENSRAPSPNTFVCPQSPECNQGSSSVDRPAYNDAQSSQPQTEQRPERSPRGCQERNRTQAPLNHDKNFKKGCDHEKRRAPSPNTSACHPCPKCNQNSLPEHNDAQCSQPQNEQSPERSQRACKDRYRILPPLNHDKNYKKSYAHENRISPSPNDGTNPSVGHSQRSSCDDRRYRKKPPLDHAQKYKEPFTGCTTQRVQNVSGSGSNENNLASSASDSVLSSVREVQRSGSTVSLTSVTSETRVLSRDKSTWYNYVLERAAFIRSRIPITFGPRDRSSPIDSNRYRRSNREEVDKRQKSVMYRSISVLSAIVAVLSFSDWFY